MVPRLFLSSVQRHCIAQVLLGIERLKFLKGYMAKNPSALDFLVWRPRIY